jgi:hypothetical protein
MVDMKRVLLAVTLAVTFAFAGSALAQGKKDQAPGQTGANPGQTFKTQRDDPTITNALPPGQQNKIDPGASPPGGGVENFGRSKKDEVPGERW